MTAQSPDDQAATVRLWSLTEETVVEVGDDGALSVITWWGEYDFPAAPEPVRDWLRRMALGPVSMANAGIAGEVGWPAGLRRLLDRLAGSVVHSLAFNDGRGPVLSAIPVTHSPAFPLDALPAERWVKLSRFASIRPSGGALLVESPTARYRVVLVQRAAVLVASALAAATTVGQVARSTGVPGEVTADLLAFLVAAGVVLTAEDPACFAEDSDAELAVWSADDLLFHTHSRTRQRDGGAAVTGEEHRTAAAPPVVKQTTAGPTYPLYRPGPDAAGPTLAALLETDHSCPEFSERALATEQLGELLYRTARVRSVGPAYLPGGPGHEASQRPYFSVACLYELEIYVSVNRCSGIARGIYHYDPLWHTLTLINDDAADLAVMLDMAMVAGGSHRRPAVLLTMTARMARTAWVLGSAAYATTLMHVGALQQTLYLNAKAMGLAAHAVPVDAADRVDRALKLEWPAEVGVGECVLDLPW